MGIKKPVLIFLAMFLSSVCGYSVSVLADTKIQKFGDYIFEKDSQERLKKIVNPDKSVTTYYYDAQNNLDRVTDTKIGKIKYEYKNNLLSRIIYPNGLKFSFKYDTGGNVIETYYPDGTTVSYEYVMDDHISKIYSDFGELTYNYDETKRLESVIDADGNKYIFNYDNENNLSGITYPSGKTVSEIRVAYQWSELGKLENVKSPFVSFFYKYDDQGRLITKMDYLGIKTFLEYDANSIFPKYSINQFEYIKYDDSGNPVNSISVNGLKAIWKWKDKDHIESVSTPGTGTMPMGMRTTMASSTWRQTNSLPSPLFRKNARNYSSSIPQGMKTLGYSATKIKPINNPPSLNSLISSGRQFRTNFTKFQLSEPVQKYQGSLASIGLSALTHGKSYSTGVSGLATALGTTTGFMRIHSKYSPQQRTLTNPEFLEENLLHTSQSFFSGAMIPFGVPGAIASAAYKIGSNELINIARKPTTSLFYNLITYPEWKTYQISERKFGRTPSTLSQYRAGGITTQEKLSSRNYFLPPPPPPPPPHRYGGSLSHGSLGGIYLTTTLEYSLDKNGILQELDSAISEKLARADDESSEIEIGGKKYQFAKIPLKKEAASKKTIHQKKSSAFLRTGNFVYNEIDFCIEKADDLCIGFYRFYDSFRVSKSEFGYGWTPFPYAIEFNTPISEKENKPIYSKILVYDNINGREFRYEISDFKSEDQENITFYESNQELAPILIRTADKKFVVVDEIGRLFNFDHDGRLLFQEMGDIKLSYLYKANRLSAIESSKGKLIEFTYDKKGRIANAKAEGNIASNYTYDPSGELFTRDSSEYEMVAYYYNDKHFLEQIVLDSDKEDQDIILSYDENGRIVSVGKGDTEVVAKYNDADKVVKIIDPENNKEIEYSFLDEDRLSTVIWPDKRVTAFSYGGNGRIFQVAEGKFDVDNNLKKIRFDQVVTY